MADRSKCSSCGKRVDRLYAGKLCKKCHQDKISSFAEAYIYKKVEGQSPTIFQAHMHQKLKDACEFDNVLLSKEVRKIFFNSHIPLTLHRMFLQEMKDLKLISNINMNQIKIL